MKKQLLIVLPVLFLAFSCVNNNRPEKVEMKSEEETKIIENNGSEIAFADFTLQKPKDWITSQPSSQMRLVEFITPKSPEDPIVGFYFGDREDMVKANIQRWRGQFASEDDFSKKEFDHGQIFVEIMGTFKKKPMPMAQEFEEVENYKMLAAIIPSNEGPYFFKVTAPGKQIDMLKSEFLAFLKSYEKK